MSIWGKVAGAVAGAYLGGPLGAIAGAVAGHFVLDRALTQEAAFTIALIALSAKMAKVDGMVSPLEVEAFYRICRVPDGEQKNVARVYQLAQEDVAGFEAYARQVAEIFASRPKVYEDVLDALFHIAYADGDLHPSEEAFLRRVSEIFSLRESDFIRIHARHNAHYKDPYAVLAVAPEADNKTVKEAWLAAVRDNHPDRLQARGLPKEIIHLANSRMATINNAWQTIRKERGL
ncbi:MAG: TerB family tellurite resistance protein [Alphaproteobacteria bacterium]|nr:TerB family tellurite resistance protein [Alphaproteobacteria bacterium]